MSEVSELEATRAALGIKPQRDFDKEAEAEGQAMGRMRFMACRNIKAKRLQGKIQKF